MAFWKRKKAAPSEPKASVDPAGVNIVAAPVPRIDPAYLERRVLGNLSAPIPLDELTVVLYEDEHTPVVTLVEGQADILACLEKLHADGLVCVIGQGTADEVIAACNSVLPLHPEKEAGLRERYEHKWASRLTKDQWYWTPGGYEVLTGVPFNG